MKRIHYPLNLRPIYAVTDLFMRLSLIMKYVRSIYWVHPAIVGENIFGESRNMPHSQVTRRNRTLVAIRSCIHSMILILAVSFVLKSFN